MTMSATRMHDQAKCPSARLVIMGPSGCGKSTVGAALAAILGVPFVDGDALHPLANLAKMSSKQPLTDADRWPWLDQVASRLRDGPMVIACSALARRYRAHIVHACPQAMFIELRVPAAELRRRTSTRRHFMPSTLLDSQLSAWERLQSDEPGISIVNTGDVEHVAASIQSRMIVPATR